MRSGYVRKNKPLSVVAGGEWIWKFADGAMAMGLSLSVEALERFSVYAVMLQGWGRRMNLTSKLDASEIMSLHFLDSLALLAVRPPAPTSSLVDLGSGAGFPGLPLKIARPDLSVTLVEPQLKKAAFLREAVHRLKLSGILVKQARAGGKGPEENIPEHDVAVCRALAQTVRLLEMGRGAVRKGGWLAAYKGKGEGEEMNHLQVEGWIYEGESSVDIPGKDTARSMLFFRRE